MFAPPSAVFFLRYRVPMASAIALNVAAPLALLLRVARSPSALVFGPPNSLALRAARCFQRVANEERRANKTSFHVGVGSDLMSHTLPSAKFSVNNYLCHQQSFSEHFDRKGVQAGIYRSYCFRRRSITAGSKPRT
jgi:hypothetical protein